jgi:hypothetical protein
LTSDSRIGAAVTLGATLFCAFMALAGFPASLWFQQQSPPVAMPWSTIVVAWVLGAVVLAGLAYFSPTVIRWTLAFARLVSGRFAYALLFGLVVRVVVALVVRPQPSSDGATYLGLAAQLANGTTYHSGGTFAYWPPGLPLLLSVFVKAGVPTFALLVAFGLLSFVLAAFGLRKLGVALGLRTYATLPVWLLAAWPSPILCTGLPEKEIVVLAFVVWAVYFCVVALRGSLPAAIACGVTLGLAVLTQPALQLLAIVPFVAAVLMPRGRGPNLGRALVVAVAMLLTVTPWIYRNSQVLDGALILTTNGGENLYRANNELATGAYVRVGKVNLDALPELESNRIGKGLAVDWILGNPGQFVMLTAGRLLLFAGDDSHGAFVALKRGQAVALGGAPYAAAKLVCALPLIVLWCALAALLIRERAALAGIWVPLCIAMTAYFYLVCIHAVFESGGRYHLPVLGCLFVTFALAIERVSPAAARSA